jgi:hypothetical protein
MNQLVGSPCAKCQKTIPSIVVGQFCRECGNPIHNACKSASSRPDDCPICGCEKKSPSGQDASTRSNTELPHLKITPHGVLSTWRFLQMMIGGIVVTGAGIGMILLDARLYGIFLICAGIAVFSFGIWTTLRTK